MGACLPGLEQRRSQRDAKMVPEGPQLSLLVVLEAPQLLRTAGPLFDEVSFSAQQGTLGTSGLWLRIVKCSSSL